MIWAKHLVHNSGVGSDADHQWTWNGRCTGV